MSGLTLAAMIVGLSFNQPVEHSSVEELSKYNSVCSIPIENEEKQIPCKQFMARLDWLDNRKKYLNSKISNNYLGSDSLIPNYLSRNGIPIGAKHQMRRFGRI